MTNLKYRYYGDKFVKRKKYSNRSCKCWNKDHAPHGSILEAAYCNELSLLKKSGAIADYETQFKIVCDVNGRHVCNHYVDFLVTNNDGTKEFHETKGFDQDVWKLKRKLVEALYPDIPYIVKREKQKWRKF